MDIDLDEYAFFVGVHGNDGANLTSLDINHLMLERRLESDTIFSLGFKNDI